MELRPEQSVDCEKCEEIQHDKKKLLIHKINAHTANTVRRKKPKSPPGNLAKEIRSLNNTISKIISHETEEQSAVLPIHVTVSSPKSAPKVIALPPPVEMIPEVIALPPPSQKPTTSIIQSPAELMEEDTLIIEETDDNLTLENVLDDASGSSVTKSVEFATQSKERDEEIHCEIEVMVTEPSKKQSPKTIEGTQSSLICFDCDYTAATKDQLKGHVKSEHTITNPQKEPVFECHECEYRNEEKWKLRDHVKLKHTLVKKEKEVFFECYKCEFIYKSKNDLMRHIISQHGQTTTKEVHFVKGKG